MNLKIKNSHNKSGRLDNCCHFFIFKFVIKCYSVLNIGLFFLLFDFMAETSCYNKYLD